MGGDYLTELEEVSSMAGSDTETLQRHRNAAQLRRPRSRRWGTEAVPLKCLLRYPLSDLIENRHRKRQTFFAFQRMSGEKGWKMKHWREREREGGRRERVQRGGEAWRGGGEVEEVRENGATHFFFFFFVLFVGGPSCLFVCRWKLFSSAAKEREMNNLSAHMKMRRVCHLL